MHMLRKKTIPVALLMLAPIFCLGQQDSTKKNELSIGVNYQTRLHYFGRTDSLQSSGLLPNIGFQLKNGLYIQSNFIFIQNKASSVTYAGTTIEGGYRFKPSKQFNGNIFYTQILYKDKSELPQSALKAQTGINASYKTVVNINAGADLKFSGKQTDIGTTLGLDHIFVLHKAGSHVAFAIDPSLYMYAGTQKFTKTYIERKSFLGIPVSEQETTQTYDGFNILAYEASVPVVAVAGKFYAVIIPAYVVPQHLLEGETGKNLFYLTLGVGFKFSK
ncbi:hypothetical protein A8C56_02000 [Niabella ginsenosidivorans]|uniref:Outer membrane protein beta-barrel domain-containing protein n=1 Tax=Niabella ginsenosidivorans TaxID=1176587 RepID=A0A1A9HZL3_9BACT|nr:hypothetical protein [Niabella ginsenosidivorans]ANH79910.1 hypothetical protein A8C56_02000 [Niabella ginsenosidivorans]